MTVFLILKNGEEKKYKRVRKFIQNGDCYSIEYENGKLFIAIGSIESIEIIEK